MEASAIPASVGLTRTRIAIGAPLLRIRSDEQLVSLFRAGNDEAFRVIHDRYRQRLFIYTRQMLGGSAADAEDAVQEIFVRAYAGLRASNRELALRAWLYRIAHNRCIDELRRLRPATTDSVDTAAVGVAHDPVARVEQRDALRRLIDDVQRLPEQQRSALLMRELGGVAYADIAGALTVSVPAVKSLLVRARVGLAQANEARDTACAEIREDLILSHDRGVRTSGLVRRHMRDCPSCREFRGEVRGVSRQFAALAPTLGPIGVVAKLLGVGGGGGAAAGGMSGGGAAAAGTGAAAGAGALVGAGHVVTLLAAAVVTAGSAIEMQQVSHPARHAQAHHRIVHASRPALTPSAPSAPTGQSAVSAAPAVAASTPSSTPNAAPVDQAPASTTAPVARRKASHSRASNSSPPLLISQTADPDQLSYNQLNSSSDSTATSGETGSSATGAGSAGTATGTGSPGSSDATPGTTSGSPTPAGADGAGAAGGTAAGGTAAGATTNSQGSATSGGGATTSSTQSTGSGSGGTSTGGSASTSRGSGQVAAVFTTSR